MKKEIFKYLRNNFPQEPEAVDRLIISAFLSKNNLDVEKNKFLQKYQIEESSVEWARLDKFISLFDKYKIEFSFETLVEFFEFVISPADKIVTGAVYTPNNIRELIVSETLKGFTNLEKNFKVCDTACGCGGFLYTAAKKIKQITNQSYAEIFKSWLFGLDIQDYSINRAKLLLTLLAVSEGENNIESFEFNLFVGNALEFEWNRHIEAFTGFDVIVGNPPYVCSKNIDDYSKQLLKNWSVCSTGHPDLYIPFFQIGLENLKANGVLGYITMNTFFKSVNGRALREYFQNKSLEIKILDFGGQQIFQSKSTYTCICIIRNTKASGIKYKRSNGSFATLDTTFEVINYSKLKPQKGWSLNNFNIIEKIESTGTPFGELYSTRNGIATLKNEIYIFQPIDEDSEFFYLKNGSVFPIEKNICKEIVNPNKLTKVDSIEPLKEKAIFPYFYNEAEQPILYSEKELKENYPNAYKYLTEKRNILSKRDKGKGSYEKWYAYGRNQSLDRMKYKLLYPHITPSTPNFVINTNEELLFYNGIAVIAENERELKFLQKLMSSKLFWFYIKNTSKPYGSGFFSLSRNYVKNFGIYNFSEQEEEYIISEKDSKKLNTFIESKYQVNLTV